MTPTALKQTAFANVYKLELGPEAVSYSRSEALSSRKVIPYRKITGIFQDAERCYIVWEAEVVHFLHQADNPEYQTFVGQLLARVKSPRGT